MLLNHFPEINQFIELAERHNVIPVCAEILADTETPVSLLKKFHDRESPVFLFESVEGGERWGRYSFIGTSARTHIRIFSNDVEIKMNGSCEKIPHNGDPLAVLRTFMNRFKPAQINELPRFWGGLVGYMTYEMVSFFEKIPNRLPEGNPIAHFIIPDELIIFDNVRNTLLCVVVTFSEDGDDPGKRYNDASHRIKGMLKRMEMAVSPRDERTLDFHLSPLAVYDDEDYRQKVIRTKEYILAGDIIQSVISQPFVCDAPTDLIELYRAKRYINPSPYLFFMDYGDTALVGSSPEVMVRLENDIATLRPIAGTRARGKSEKEDRELADELLSDEKEKAEHLMLVDLGRNDLGRIAETGTVQVTDLMIVERYSHVMHLVSNINCDIKPDKDAWDLIRATFPAGTLSGAPKVRAMEIIAELENEPRGPYGGAVGYVSFSGNMDLAITIRTAIVEKGKLTVRAGAGIVADSDPEKERIETVNKAKAIEKALHLLKRKTINLEE
ncbi:MAG: chorismate-binding protein [Proteobacteria bacterium]|nr:chorismate-binding protein [Pseudomonadota bacterium]